MASRKFNPEPIRAMDAMRNDADPTTFIFHLVGQTSVDGPIPLRELLIQGYEKWDQICASGGLQAPCPIQYTEDEISKARQAAEAWAEVFNEYESLRLDVLGKDGWVSHEEFEEAKAIYDEHKAKLERLRRKVNEAACI